MSLFFETVAVFIPCSLSMTDLPGPSLFGTARDKAELFRERYSILQQVRNVCRASTGMDPTSPAKNPSCCCTSLPPSLAQMTSFSSLTDAFMTLFLGLVLLPGAFFRLSFIVCCYWSSVSWKQILVKGTELLKVAGWNRVRTFWSVFA